jgi:transposase
MSDVTIHRNGHMTNGRVEVITTVERRRRWSWAEKQRLVTASLEPGASVSAIAREARIHPSQLYGWRRQLRGALQTGFAAVQIAPDAASAGVTGSGAIEIEFASGARMRITGAVDPAILTAAVAALADGRRQ